MKKIFLIILVITSSSALAQFNKAGRTAMQFLKIGIGAREAAMGEACIANINDIGAAFWNPAALTYVKNPEATFNYVKWFGDLNIIAGAAGMNLFGFGTFSISAVSLDYGEIPEALVTSTSGGLDTRTGNTFTGGDIVVGFSFARKFTDKLSIGLSAKYIQEDLHTYSSSVWAFDIGSHYDVGWKGIRLAMSAQNLSGNARWMYTLDEEQQTHELPILYRIGASIDLLGGSELFLGGSGELHKWSLNIDAIHSNDYAERLHVGTEYKFFDVLALRGGYRFNYEEGSFSLGAGLFYDYEGITLKFDYAYVQFDYLDSPHRFTLSMGF